MLSVSYADEQAVELLSSALSKKLLLKYPYSEPVILCIGTDRSTGDALGPLVGSKLRQSALPLPVYGHLDEPVHAVNLEETIRMIHRRHRNACLLAVDACLGRLKNVGQIHLADGPLKPGAGVKKDLPEVGDYHITGTVNVGGLMEYAVLQNTRLSLVMRMADVIAAAILLAARKIIATRDGIATIEWAEKKTDVGY